MSTPKITGTITRGLASPGLDEDTFEADLITGGLDLERDVTPASGATPSSGTIPLLWQHNPEQVVGVARYRRVGDVVKVTCTLIPKGTTKEGDLARVCAKQDFGIGVSAGFLPTKTSPIKGTSGKRYDSYKLLEASLVAIPADPKARITARDYDADRAARIATAEAYQRTGRMQHARSIIAREPPMTKQERVAAVREREARAARGADAPQRPSIPHSHEVFRLQRETNPSKYDRMLKASLLAAKTRPAGY